MKVYRLTNTLDDYVDFYTDNHTEAEIIVVGGSKIELEKYPKLKYIFKCGVGVDNIPNLEGTGITLVMPSEETKKCIYDEVSSFTINGILSAHYRNSGDLLKWDKIERVNLKDKKAVLIGVGNIGKMVCKKLENLVSVTCYDPLLEESMYSSLEEAIKSNDIVSLHCPLTDYNKNMINTKWLKDEVILVNTARAELVDEYELYNFLKNNPKSTAVFDVFWKEPYRGKLLELENFIATPHVASMGDGFRKGLYNDLLCLIKEI